jgi:hypothetical protein
MESMWGKTAGNILQLAGSFLGLQDEAAKNVVVFSNRSIIFNIIKTHNHGKVNPKY